MYKMLKIRFFSKFQLNRAIIRDVAWQDCIFIERVRSKDDGGRRITFTHYNRTCLFTIALFYYADFSILLEADLSFLPSHFFSLYYSVNIDDFRSARGRNCTRCGVAAICPSSSCRRATKFKMNILPLKYLPSPDSCLKRIRK